MRKTKKPITNVDLVKDIMEFSEFGAMAQIFVMDALHKMSKRVAESKVEDYPEDGFINPEAWIGVAKEIQTKLNSRN